MAEWLYALAAAGIITAPWLVVQAFWLVGGAVERRRGAP